MQKIPLGELLTTERNIDTITSISVTTSAARSPESCGIRKLIHDIKTKSAEGIYVCIKNEFLFRVSVIVNPGAE